MKKVRLVNKKVITAFAFSMISLFTFSNILSVIDVNEDLTNTSASVTDIKRTEENKVDNLEVYSKDTIVTKKEEVTENQEETVEPTPNEEENDVQENITNETAEESNQTEETQNKEETQQVSTPAPAVTGTKAEYQAYAYSQFAKYGWNETDYNNLITLWNRESGWNPNAHNSYSGAHGIAQALPASKMASYGEDYMTSYVTQINWGLDYISNRYGNPTNALNSLQTKGWY